MCHRHQGDNVGVSPAAILSDDALTATTPPPFRTPDPFKPFIIFSNRHEIRRIDLYKGEFSVLVPGLRNTIALDFHLNQSALYWTDVVEDKIYRGKLSENGGQCCAVTLMHMVISVDASVPPVTNYMMSFPLNPNRNQN